MRRDPEAFSRVVSDGRQCEAAMRLEAAAVARGDLLAAADAAEVAELYSALAFATAEAAYA